MQPASPACQLFSSLRKDLIHGNGLYGSYPKDRYEGSSLRGSRSGLPGHDNVAAAGTRCFEPRRRCPRTSRPIVAPPPPGEPPHDHPVEDCAERPRQRAGDGAHAVHAGCRSRNAVTCSSSSAPSPGSTATSTMSASNGRGGDGRHPVSTAFVRSARTAPGRTDRP
jgi:hypothetical protein